MFIHFRTASTQNVKSNQVKSILSYNECLSNANLQTNENYLQTTTKRQLANPSVTPCPAHTRSRPPLNQPTTTQYVNISQDDVESLNKKKH